MVVRSKIKLALTTLGFGYRGAPGIYQHSAGVTADVHGSTVSKRPHWCGPDAFRVQPFIDDGLQKEVALSNRPEESTRSYGSALGAVLGLDTPNVPKFFEEGVWASAMIVLGLGVDASTLSIWLPEAKAQKGWFLVSLPCFRRGCRVVPLVEGQRLAGTLQSWLVLFPALGHELRVIHQLICSADGLFCQPRGNPEQLDAFWATMWDAIDFVRVVLTDPEMWSANFGRPLSHILPFEGQIAIPGGIANVTLAIADATPSLMAGTSWKSGHYHRTPAKPLHQVLVQIYGDGGWIIPISELGAHIVTALLVGPLGVWSGQPIFLGSDNQLTVGWVESRKAGPEWARILLRILRFPGCLFEFVTRSGYIRTYHNTWNDDVTRLDEAQVKRAQELGLVELKMKQGDFERLVGAWKGDPHEPPRHLRHARRPGPEGQAPRGASAAGEDRAHPGPERVGWRRGAPDTGGLREGVRPAAVRMGRRVALRAAERPSRRACDTTH